MEELLACVGAELKKPQEEISDELVFLVNSRIRPPKPVNREDIFVRAMFLVSDEVNSYGGRFPLEELHKLVELVIDSPVMVGHTKEKLPIARNFKAEIVQKDGQNWVKVWFYWLKNSKDALSLKENIDHGIYKECSLGFVFEFPECSICGQDMRKCPHVPFKSYETQNGEEKAYFNYRNVARVLETSLVYRGAVPNTSMSDELRLYQKPGVHRVEENQTSSLDSNRTQDSTQKQQDIRPFDFVRPTEPQISDSTANVIFHLEDLPSLSGEFLIEPKYDGIRSQIHKRGDEVKIFFDRGQEIQHAFPHLVEEILHIPEESFILDGELVRYKGNSRLSHKDTLAFFSRMLNPPSNQDGLPPDDSHFRFKAFDLLHLNGEDKTTLPLEARKRLLLELFPNTSHFQKVKWEKATVGELNPTVKATAASEGALLKRSDSVYFEGESWYEWRRQPELDVLVTEAEKNKGGSYNYTCAVGKKDRPIPIGTTYSTFLEANPGEIIRVKVESITEEEGSFSWHAPKVLERRPDKKEPDPLAVLRRMVNKDLSGIYGTKSTAEDMQAADGQPQTKDSFILQVHCEGNSNRHHLRFQRGDMTLGLTIFDLDLEALGRGRRFLCEWKDYHNSEWMNSRGEISPKKNPTEGKPVQKQAIGMKTLDSGKYRILERQADFSRIQIDGEILNEVYLVGKVRLKGKDRWLLWRQSTVKLSTD